VISKSSGWAKHWRAVDYAITQKVTGALHVCADSKEQILVNLTDLGKGFPNAVHLD
jgi:hypothetical protein